jgi:O-succinylbenzoate synthase
MQAAINLNETGVFENQEPLFIEKITIHQKTLELNSPFRTSFGSMLVLPRFYPVIEFRREDGSIVKGIGECSPLSEPAYNHECYRGAGVSFRYITASLTGKKYEEADGLPADNNPPVDSVYSFINRYKWIVGHNIAKTGFEGAYWDAVAQINNLPVFALWGGVRKQVSTGISIGMEISLELLLRKIDIAIEKIKPARIKLKVKPGNDILSIEAIRKKYPSLPLQVDANSSYDLFNREHLALLKEFDNYGLLMIEQPGAHDDIFDHAGRLAELKTPICLDESILHAQHARKAVELWKQRSAIEKLIINIKPPRVGGYWEAVKIAALCGKAGVKTWCGGMLESALGKTANIHFSSRAEINLPGDHVSVGPYFKEDAALPPESENGFLKVPSTPGWGIKGPDITRP